MAIIRAGAPGLDPKPYGRLVQNPLIKFGAFSGGSNENPKEFVGFFLSWTTSDFEQEVQSSIRVLQADEPWLQKMRSGDVNWSHGPQLELFAEPRSPLILPHSLLRLAADRGLEIHIRIIELEEPDVQDMLDRWRQSLDEPEN